MGSVKDRVNELIARSNRLGANPRNTNYAGGNTSAKGTAPDPVTAQSSLAAVRRGEDRRVGAARAPHEPSARPRRTGAVQRAGHRASKEPDPALSSAVNGGAEMPVTR